MTLFMDVLCIFSSYTECYINFAICCCLSYFTHTLTHMSYLSSVSRDSSESWLSPSDDVRKSFIKLGCLIESPVAGTGASLQTESIFCFYSSALFICMSYCVRRIMILWNQAAVVPSAMLTAPLLIRVLDASMVYDDRHWQNYHGFHHKCYCPQFLPCSTVMHIEIGARSDVEMCIRFSGKYGRVPQ